MVHGPKDGDVTMLNQAIAKAHRIAARFRTLKDWKPGNIFARVADKAKATGNLYIYDIIGIDWWTGEGITAQAVAAALEGLSGVKTLNVYINSEGGDVFEAKAIYTQLKRFDAEKVVWIDGIAASAATFVAMAGDKIVTAPEATWMVHEAWGGAMGQAADLRAYADVLDMMNNDIATIYSKRTGASVDEMKALMAKTMWMTAQEALALKFTDEITKDEPAAADTATVAASRMAAAADATSRVLTITAADRMKFVAASLNSVRASPAKRVVPASR